MVSLLLCTHSGRHSALLSTKIATLFLKFAPDSQYVAITSRSWSLLLFAGIISVQDVLGEVTFRLLNVSLTLLSKENTLRRFAALLHLN